MSQSIITQKAEDFAVRIVKYSHYVKERKEYSLADQLLRSGTSICANLYEAKYAQSDADFISKQSIALKEASETDFWLRLLARTGMIDQQTYLSMDNDVQELIRLLVSSIKSMKQKQRNT